MWHYEDSKNAGHKKRGSPRHVQPLALFSLEESLQFTPVTKLTAIQSSQSHAALCKGAVPRYCSQDMSQTKRGDTVYNWRESLEAGK